MSLGIKSSAFLMVFIEKVDPIHPLSDKTSFRTAWLITDQKNLTFKFLGKWMLNPQEGGRLDAKRHYVILAMTKHRYDQLAKYHPVPWLR